MIPSNKSDQQVEIEIKYAGYMTTGTRDRKVKSLEGKRIPDSFDYSAIPSLRKLKPR